MAGAFCRLASVRPSATKRSRPPVKSSAAAVERGSTVVPSWRAASASGRVSFIPPSPGSCAARGGRVGCADGRGGDQGHRWRGRGGGFGGGVGGLGGGHFVLSRKGVFRRWGEPRPLLLIEPPAHRIAAHGAAQDTADHATGR